MDLVVKDLEELEFGSKQILSIDIHLSDITILVWELNKLDPMVNKETGEILSENDITNIKSELYEENEPPEFTIEIFEDVGKAVWWGLLDLIDKNPISRLTKSEFKNIEGVRKHIEKYVTDTWGLEEKLTSPPEKRPWHSLPRVALLGPKVQNKIYDDKVKEMKEQKEKERIRLERFRKGYLQEMRERRENELNKNIECVSQINNDDNISVNNDNSDQLSTSFKSLIDNQNEGFYPYSHSASKRGSSPPLLHTYFDSSKLENYWCWLVNWIKLIFNKLEV